MLDDGSTFTQYLEVDGVSVTNLTQASSASTTSDVRLKNSIAPLSQDYEIIFDNLEPVSYKYNNGTSGRTHIGFIA